MRLALSSTLYLLSVPQIHSFAPPTPSSPSRCGSCLPPLRSSAVDTKSEVAHGETSTATSSGALGNGYQFPPHVVPLTGEEIIARRDAQFQKLRMKDKTSTFLEKEDLKIVYEDEDVIVIDKPSGVLTVSGKDKSNPSLAQAVYDALGDKVVDLPTADHMVVHRLGMDTSGLIVMAKNKDAVRGLNGVFRERKVERQYEALVVGHVDKDEGLISLPIMRDYEFPPYVRISTDDHQRALLDLDPEVVGKQLLELPKASITKYQVVSREEYNGRPVTRVKLTSISGRYHQLNVHMAAFGHPIVGDTVYGVNGVGVTNGGLTPDELESLAPNPRRASDELQWAIAKESSDKPTCSHAKFLKFRHPTKKGYVTLDFTTESPF